MALNDKGRAQALAAGRMLGNIKLSRVLTSPLHRAVETARLAFASDNSLIETEELLIECDFGCLEGRSIKQVMQEHGITRKDQLADILPDDGEQWVSVIDRCQALLVRLSMIQQTEAHVVLVGHDAVLQGVSELLTGEWFDSRHGQPYLFGNPDGPWRISAFG